MIKTKVLGFLWGFEVLVLRNRYILIIHVHKDLFFCVTGAIKKDFS